MVRVIRSIFLAIRFLTPWVIRIVGFMSKLILTTVCSMWIGVPTAVERIATEWMNRAVAAGLPTEFDSILYWIFKIVAYAMIVAGWIGCSYLTVWLLDRIL